MRTLAAAAIGLATLAASAPPLLAQDIGVASCDAFIKIYEGCLATKAPPAQQAQMKSALDQVKTNWKAVAATEDGKKSLEGVCKQTADTLKAQLAPLGCQF
jgi:hypothetical protein